MKNKTNTISNALVNFLYTVKSIHVFNMNKLVIWKSVKKATYLEGY